MESTACPRSYRVRPPGLRWQKRGPATEQVRRHPYFGLLFDEFEKAFRMCSTLLLQILEDGRFNGWKGRTVDFRTRAGDDQ